MAESPFRPTTVISKFWSIAGIVSREMNSFSVIDFDIISMTGFVSTWIFGVSPNILLFNTSNLFSGVELFDAGIRNIIFSKSCISDVGDVDITSKAIKLHDEEC